MKKLTVQLIGNAHPRSGPAESKYLSGFTTQDSTRYAMAASEIDDLHMTAFHIHKAPGRWGTGMTRHPPP